MYCIVDFYMHNQLFMMISVVTIKPQALINSTIMQAIPALRPNWLVELAA